MLRPGRFTLAVLVCALGAAAPASALIVVGGGSSRTDCLAVFDAPANHPPDKPKQIRCADGDPACDADGVVNGSCSFPVGMCANSTVDPARCTVSGVESIRVDHAEDNGDPKFDTDFQALQSRIDNQIDPPNAMPDDCTLPATIRVTLVGPLPGGVCKSSKKKIKVTTLSTFQLGKQTKDVDKLQLVCLPPVGGCDPQVLFADTYDRIQRQVFNRSCALSGCHDSQSQTGGMLLEPAGSYSNLVDVVPINATAAGLGWKRVDATNASADTSFLYHKITGDLDTPALGARMPFNRPKLDAFLIDIVRLWIEAGAPQTGWVPGTEN